MTTTNKTTKALTKEECERLLVSWVVSNNPACYRGHEDDALAFVRHNWPTRRAMLERIALGPGNPRGW